MKTKENRNHIGYNNYTTEKIDLNIVHHMQLEMSFLVNKSTFKVADPDFLPFMEYWHSRVLFESCYTIITQSVA